MNDQDDRHLSTLALDDYWTSGRPTEPGVLAHLARCARCRGYVEGLGELEAAARAAPPPPLEERPPAPASRRAPRWLAVAGATALAAGVALAVVRLPSSGVYVASKGAPAVEVLVHRAAETRPWDGRSAVRPGDALALRVACAGLRRVAVAVPRPPAWESLAAVDCPASGEALPFTLVVDDAPGDEQLAVVMSEDSLASDRLEGAVASREQSRHVWVVQLVLPKEKQVP